MTALAAARYLSSFWPREACIAATGLPTCIETTRHVVEAFRVAGVPDVRALPCALSAFNKQAAAFVMSGGDGQAAPGAQVVEVSPEAKDSRPTHAGRRGWHAHLVVDHPTFLLDLVLPGVFVSTGAKGFEHVGSFCGEKGNELVDVDGAWMAMSHDGLCFRYRPRPELASYRNTEAWRGTLDRFVVEELAREIASKLEPASPSVEDVVDAARDAGRA